MVTLFFGLIAGIALGEACAYLRRQQPAKPAQPSFIEKAASLLPASWKPEPKPEAAKKPLGTIPRTPGSWRRQRLELQKQHNTKQKERDALTGAMNHATQTR